MKISLKINKTLEENAQEYFKKAKKIRKKIDGAEKAIERTKIKIFDYSNELNRTKQKLAKADNNEKIEVKNIKKIKSKQDKKWFDKFHWFVTSSGLLVVAGRDADTNEEVIKKYANKEDIVLHTDMSGSPFAVIKKEQNKDISEKDIEEAADFILAYSRAWKKGFGSADIFYVTPEQVTKTANPGEYLPKGAFMIRGKTNYITNKINFCIGIYDKEENDFAGRIFSGPEEAAKIHCSKYFKLIPGREKISQIAKIIKSKLASEIDLDEFIRVIPASSELKK